MKRNLKQYFITILLVLIALVFLVGYMINVYYTSAKDDSLQLGEMRLRQEKEDVSSYMARALDCVEMTASQVEYMIGIGADNEEILSFLTNETMRFVQSTDTNFTGIYGWINGEYLDGIGWVPDSDYIATNRDWYLAAKEAGQEPALVEPYVDAQTGDMMLSISQMLSDGESVISLDIRMDRYQEMVENITKEGSEYGFVCDEKGLLIAHSDISKRGMLYGNKEVLDRIVNQVDSHKHAHFEAAMDGIRCTVFGEEILSGWYAVMVVTNESLYQEVNSVIIKCIMISLAVIIAILVYLFLHIRREAALVKSIYESREVLKKHSLATLGALAKSIEAKDDYTKGHSARVAKYSRMIAARMGKSEEEQDEIYKIALLHDVGKIRVPGAIINKEGKLTDEEFVFIKLHTIAGYNILRDIPGNEQLILGARFHHERYDGKGYPNGLSGENIPEYARIIAVADSYDAMASNRSYRKALPQEVIRNEIEKGKGSQFDPVIADIMLRIIDEDTEYQLRELGVLEKTILVVDDSSIIITLTENILSTESRYHVLKATSGSEALDIVSRNHVDLVLLDVEMPKMDGFETFEKIREIKEIPVIFMTADKELSTINRARSRGAEDYITKPFDPPILLEMIRGTLNSIGEEL